MMITLIKHRCVSSTDIRVDTDLVYKKTASTGWVFVTYRYVTPMCHHVSPRVARQPDERRRPDRHPDTLTRCRRPPSAHTTECPSDGSATSVAAGASVRGASTVERASRATSVAGRRRRVRAGVSAGVCAGVRAGDADDRRRVSCASIAISVMRRMLRAARWCRHARCSVRAATSSFLRRIVLDSTAWCTRVGNAASYFASIWRFSSRNSAVSSTPPSTCRTSAVSTSRQCSRSPA